MLTPLLLSAALAAPNATDIERTVSQLSSANAVHVLPMFMQIDRSARWSGDMISALEAPYPAGEAGKQELARRITAVRQQVDAKQGKVYAASFTGAPVDVKPAPVRTSAIHLRLDFAPARVLLDLLESGEREPARIVERLRREDVRTVFEALIQHRSQSFYGPPMSLELLAQNIAFANTDEPVYRLYRLATPHAFMDFADVRAQAPAYRRLLQTLESHQDQLIGQVLASLQDHVPDDAHVERTVSFLFCAGADGWASNSVAGIDLEFFKDDYARMLNLMIHESYHAAQDATSRSAPAKARDAGEEVWFDALDTLFNEGTATYVMPPQVLAPEVEAKKVERGAALLEELAHAAFAAHNVQQAGKLLSEGSSGAGPLYWLGRAMSAQLVQANGPRALAAILPGGSRAFIEAYARLPDRNLLPPALLTRMRASLPGQP